MDNSKIIEDIFKRTVLRHKDDITDILAQYDLTSDQRKTVDDYVAQVNNYKEEHESRKAFKVYWEKHSDVIKKGKKYMTIGGAAAGAILGLFDKNPLTVVFGGIVGGLCARYVEELAHPLASKLGLPDPDDVPGTLSHISNLTFAYSKKLKE